MHLSENDRSMLLNLARDTIRRALRAEDLGNSVLPVDAALIQAALLQLGGSFVSLHESATHRLRGCVGGLDADRPIFLAVQDSARAVLNDPRFASDPVTLAQLQHLQIEITLTSEMVAANHPLDFDPTEHGIHLTIAGQSGCFLPQVARETGWTKEHLLERLCKEKLNLPADAWRDSRARLERFTTCVVGPESFEAVAG